MKQDIDIQRKQIAMQLLLFGAIDKKTTIERKYVAAATQVSPEAFKPVNPPLFFKYGASGVPLYRLENTLGESFWLYKIFPEKMPEDVVQELIKKYWAVQNTYPKIFDWELSKISSLSFYKKINALNQCFVEILEKSSKLDASLTRDIYKITIVRTPSRYFATPHTKEQEKELMRVILNDSNVKEIGTNHTMLLFPYLVRDIKQRRLVTTTEIMQLVAQSILQRQEIFRDMSYKKVAEVFTKILVQIVEKRVKKPADGCVISSRDIIDLFEKFDAEIEKTRIQEHALQRNEKRESSLPEKQTEIAV